MIVEYGNSAPHELIGGEATPLPGPLVTRFSIDPNTDDEGRLHPGYIMGTDATEMLRHFAQNPGPVKHLGGNELLQDLIGMWDQHSTAAPTFVALVDASPYPEDLAKDAIRCIAEYWGCPNGAPADLEATHYTEYGRTVYPPGEKPISEAQVKELEDAVSPPEGDVS